MARSETTRMVHLSSTNPLIHFWPFLPSYGRGDSPYALGDHRNTVTGQNLFTIRLHPTALTSAGWRKGVSSTCFSHDPIPIAGFGLLQRGAESVEQWRGRHRGGDPFLYGDLWTLRRDLHQKWPLGDIDWGDHKGRRATNPFAKLYTRDSW